METIKKFMKLAFLALILLIVSLGYHIFSEKKTVAGFPLLNQANADVPGGESVDACAGCIECCPSGSI